MNIEPDEKSIENEAAEILKPVDDLVAREAEELKNADKTIQKTEKKSKKVFPEAKRIDD
jgi:hypothetical protein